MVTDYNIVEVRSFQHEELRHCTCHVMIPAKYYLCFHKAFGISFFVWEIDESSTKRLQVFGLETY